MYTDKVKIRLNFNYIIAKTASHKPQANGPSIANTRTTVYVLFEECLYTKLESKKQTEKPEIKHTS